MLNHPIKNTFSNEQMEQMYSFYCYLLVLKRNIPIPEQVLSFQRLVYKKTDVYFYYIINVQWIVTRLLRITMLKKGLRKHSLIGLNVNMHFVRYLSNHTRETFEMVMFESTKFPYIFIAILNIYISSFAYAP